MRITLAAPAALALALALAAPAVAAPDQTVSRTKAETTWAGKTGSGFVYTSTVSKQLPYCTPGVFDCERTLVKVEDFGKLAFSISSDPGANPALTDIDLHVYESDAQGTQGALVGESTSATNDEVVTVSDKASKVGYYLVIVDWYLGAGAYDGKVKLTPRPLSPA